MSSSQEFKPYFFSHLALTWFPFTHSTLFSLVFHDLILVKLNCVCMKVKLCEIFSIYPFKPMVIQFELYLGKLNFITSTWLIFPDFSLALANGKYSLKVRRPEGGDSETLLSNFLLCCDLPVAVSFSKSHWPYQIALTPGSRIPQFLITKSSPFAPHTGCGIVILLLHLT